MSLIFEFLLRKTGGAVRKTFITAVAMALIGSPSAWGEPETETSQAQILDTAFAIASSIPAEPHIKSRSKAQYYVFATGLSLELPDHAERYAVQLSGWYRGLAHASLALYYARHNEDENAASHLEKAEKLTATIHDWHKDRIRTVIAQAYYERGDFAAGKSAAEGIDEVEAAKADRKAITRSEESVEIRLNRLEEMLKSDRFEIKTQGLLAMTELYDQSYEQVEIRSQLESMAQDSWDLLSPMMRIDVYYLLVEAALKHSDSENALKLLQSAMAEYDNATWKPERGVPVLAQLSKLAFRAGNHELAVKTVGRAETFYNEGESGIINIYRAETLTPVAEAYHVQRKSSLSRKTYSAAIDAAVVNPNSCPRAEDLSAICVSMAECGFEPDAELKSRIEEIKNNLGNPW